MSPCASASGESWKGLDAFHWFGPQLALTGESPHAELKELAFFSRITLTKSCLPPRSAPGPNEKMGTEPTASPFYRPGNWGSEKYVILSEPSSIKRCLQVTESKFGNYLGRSSKLHMHTHTIHMCVYTIYGDKHAYTCMCTVHVNIKYVCNIHIYKHIRSIYTPAHILY